MSDDKRIAHRAAVEAGYASLSAYVAKYAATDLQAALDRAEAAERQRDEAFTAGAEAMREAAASKANDMGDWSIYEAILALPIPAKEVK